MLGDRNARVCPSLVGEIGLQIKRAERAISVVRNRNPFKKLKCEGVLLKGVRESDGIEVGEVWWDLMGPIPIFFSASPLCST